MFKGYSHSQLREAPVQEQITFTDPEVPSRACCCAARPLVKVTMPPTAVRRHSVDLWLCGHHYRESRRALRVAGADVEDLTLPVPEPRREFPAAMAREPR